MEKVKLIIDWSDEDELWCAKLHVGSELHFYSGSTLRDVIDSIYETQAEAEWLISKEY